MISPREHLIARLKDHWELAMAVDDREAAMVFDKAAWMVEGIFSGREFGTAIAVGTKAYQEELSLTHDEGQRVAWGKVIGEVEKLYIDLS